MIENRSAAPHESTLTLGGVPAGTYELRVNDTIASTIVSQGATDVDVTIPVAPTGASVSISRQ